MQLDGSARRLLREHMPTPDAIRELHGITKDPALLGLAAGAALGAWRYDDLKGWQGDAVAALLLEAGADPVVMEREAGSVLARLRADGPGIGNPASPR